MISKCMESKGKKVITMRIKYTSTHDTELNQRNMRIKYTSTHDTELTQRNMRIKYTTTHDTELNQRKKQFMDFRLMTKNFSDKDFCA